jgi:hypothetical protein
MSFGRPSSEATGCSFPRVRDRGDRAGIAVPPLFDYLRRLRKEQPEVLVGIPSVLRISGARRASLEERSSEIPADVALGLVDFFDVNCI